MADTLAGEAEALKAGTAPVAMLEGSPGSGGQAGVGLSGAASLTIDSPLGKVGDFTDGLGEQMASALNFDADKALAPVGALTKMRGQLKAPPRGALDGFGIKMEATEAGLSTDFPTAVSQSVDRLNAIFDQIPTDPSELVSLLLDQIVAVFGTLDGPEAAQIRAWLATIEELRRDVLPIIQAAADPQTITIELIGRSIRATASVFGLERVEALLASLDGFLSDPLSATLTAAIDAAFGSVGGALDEAVAQGEAGIEELRDAVMAAHENLRALQAALRPVFTILLRITEAPILAPGALKRVLEEAFDHALGAKVGDVARIDDPYKALLDRIDAAIAGIDLSSVRMQVLDSLHALRDAIASANLKAIGDLLRDALAPVAGAVDDLEGGVRELLDDLRGYVHEAAGAVRELAEGVGEFAPDGSFRFSIEDDLHGALVSARKAIGGDPDDPAAPSVAGAVREFKLAIDGFLDDITALIEPVGEAVGDAGMSIKTAIEEFGTFLEQLDVAALVQELKETVEAIVQELTPFEFSELVDPIVAELEENTEKIRAIDASKLNALLRQALSVALDLVIAIDFTATIQDPLEVEFAKVKELPAAVIAGLQERYEQALGVLDVLRPDRLLEGLLAAFDTLTAFKDQLDADKLLAPLDDLHDRYLRQPVGRLRPSVLLEPLEQAFDELRDAVGELDGAQLLAPAEQGLSELKASVAALDLTGPVDRLRSELARLDALLRALRPSKLIEPLQDDLERLDAELERFRPSKVFEPVTELAAPLLALVQAAQMEAVAALHAAFQAPLAILDRLNPEAFAGELREGLDRVIAAVEGLTIPARIQALSTQQAQLMVKAEAAGGLVRAELAVYVDVQFHLGPFVGAHDRLLAALRDIRRGLTLDDLTAAYDELRERVLGLIPAFGRELLSVEDFKRVLALASPLRFLEELDDRFDALKARLLPVSPQEIAAELDAAHAEVLAQIADLGLDERLAEIKATIERLQGIVTGLRIDFLGKELDSVLADVRAVVGGLDPARLIGDLDAIHAEVVEVVDDVKPSLLLSELQEPLDAVKAIVDAVDPRVQLLAPLNEAWETIEEKLAEVDLAAVLSPVGARLDELEDDFFAELRRTEKAFDDMLRAAKSVLKGAPPAGAAGVSF